MIVLYIFLFFIRLIIAKNYLQNSADIRKFFFSNNLIVIN